MKQSLFYLAIFTALPLTASPVDSTGKILIVYGSDTSVNGGLDTGRRHPKLTTSLYDNVAMPAYRIMDPSYRNTILDSDGRPLIMTWWMLDGGMMRGSSNTNVPYPSTLPLHLMRKYHGTSIRQFGDELTLHYHTWVWTDYDGDGAAYWNQAKSFEESRADFDITIAQDLIEEKSYPVSFRSGWHYMDNIWQNRLDEVIPFSLHNDWPARRLDSSEPIGNNYDWSRSPSAWVPFHPSLEDYQSVGNGRGWNVRSSSLPGATRSELEAAFVAASGGADQVLCLWDHLAEPEILVRLKTVNDMLHSLSSQYGIPFAFKTAVDAMQTWLNTGDTTAPSLIFTFESQNGLATFSAQSDEPIFQKEPFVAVKTRDEQYRVLSMQKVGDLRWTSLESIPLELLAKAAAAITDTVGNLSKEFLDFVPDDAFVEHGDGGYIESRGSWTSQSSDIWGTTSRFCSIAPGDSAVVSWMYQVPEARPYKVFFQVPGSNSPVTRTLVSVRSDVDSTLRTFPGQPQDHFWHYLGTLAAGEGSEIFVEATFVNGSTVTSVAAVDVVRVTPLAGSFDMTSTPADADLGFVSVDEPAELPIILENRGFLSQTIASISTSVAAIEVLNSFEQTLSTGQSVEVRLSVSFSMLGLVQDTLVIAFDGSQNVLRLPFSANVAEVVRILDNDNPAVYTESGSWNTSVATAYGLSSRFSYLSSGTGQFAKYVTTVPRTGYYEILQLVPASTNATNRALFIVSVDGNVVDSSYVDQQSAQGWTTFSIVRIPAGGPVEVRITNDGTFSSGVVLRSDAVRLTWYGDTAAAEFIVDNDGPGYRESGTWSQSVAQVFGPTSRFCLLSPEGQYASFTSHTIIPGEYDVRFIIPASVNASNHALHTVSANGQIIDSVFIDQTVGGGTWRLVGTYNLGASTTVEVRVISAGGQTSGTVLRADAVRIRLLNPADVPGLSESTPVSYSLEQNFPNPFNPQTTIRVAIPAASRLTLKVFDILGRAVWEVPEKEFDAGYAEFRWVPSDLATGMYVCRVSAVSLDGTASFTGVRKMIYVR